MPKTTTIRKTFSKYYLSSSISFAKIQHATGKLSILQETQKTKILGIYT